MSIIREMREDLGNEERPARRPCYEVVHALLPSMRRLRQAVTPCGCCGAKLGEEHGMFCSVGG